MRGSIIAGSLFAAGLALSATAPVEAAPTGTGPVGASAVLMGSGMAHSGFKFNVEDGKNVSTQAITVAPGGVIDWGANPASVIAVVKSGMLTSYPSCTGKEVWEPGHVYAATSSGVVKNEESRPAEVLAIVSNAAGTAPAGDAGHHHEHGSSPIAAMEVSAGCPTGTPAKGTDRGSGLSVGSEQFSQEEHKQFGVYLFTLQPGYSSDWHTHPGAANLVIQIKGRADNWTSCKDKEVWDPGYAYFHAPGHPHQNMTNNTGKEPAEIVAIFFDLPGWYPTSVPPVFKAPPPSDCPQHFMTSM